MSKYFDNKQDLFLEPKTIQYGSHMVTTNVKKDMKNKFVNIDTRFRDEYISNNCNASVISSYNISLPERFVDVHSISVTNIEIPNTFYNICSNFGNNTIKIIDASGNTRIVTVPDGYYTPTTLSAAITGILVTIPSLNTITCDISGNLTRFTKTGTFTGSIIIEFDVDKTGAFNKYNFKTRMGWILGFRTQIITLTNSTLSILSNFPANLYCPSYLYLVIDEFGKGNQSSFVCPLSDSNIHKNIIARISVDYKSFPYGNTIIANNGNGYLLSDVRSYTGKIDIQRINVQLVNEIGIPVNLNGGDFSFCLHMQHE
jgi:hypothetical protein